MLLCAVLAGGLMFVDTHFTRMESVRAQLSTLVAPIQWVVSLPSDVLNWGALALSEQRSLVEENARLREQLLTLSHRVQRMASLTAENVRLRELLDAARDHEVPYLTAELLSLDPDPFTHQMVIDRGRRDGVYVGQPVMDSSGIAGQVSELSAYSSRVLMLTDASHALPIQVNRNGLRFIIQGTGNYDALKVLHVPDTADIRVGDLLVSSGLAGRFPAGYPVARVSDVGHDPGEPFATVSAAPVAQLQRSRHFLLLFPPEPALEVSRGRWHPDLDPVAIESARRLGELLLPPEDDTEEDN
ncbi:rod shape-determining protein MreC [Halomonas denitrificans]|uniref:rod shape-determining protein MreC n=1 Tax=Halomonas TaxID=2745 RepID=UPI001A8E6458|nr:MULTISPECIES: rod shape-determining protein MreC [Halomonas]MED5295697.1 rod shape-determining protein MreC [Pseudomonadota bacterium]MBN8413528.1 rod shape-determining protein MreC [Halomonas litopenaei]MBY5926126.1 rod shape-determining protein MreC [Halomonas sp. DP4Y7-2]MBY5931165.1 rod shape-determining protein MreC [Halomonas sp. DP8Y7-3]MBY5969065.1 rod shape-determining protein MreC [Halomonas denitrificans]